MGESRSRTLQTLFFIALGTLPGVVLFLPIYSLPLVDGQTTYGALHEWNVLMYALSDTGDFASPGLAHPGSGMVSVLGRDYVVGPGPLWIFLIALALCVLASALAYLVPAIGNPSTIRKLGVLVVGSNLFLLFVFFTIYRNFSFLGKGSGLILVMVLSTVSTICAIAVFFSKRDRAHHP